MPLGVSPETSAGWEERVLRVAGFLRLAGLRVLVGLRALGGFRGLVAGEAVGAAEASLKWRSAEWQWSEA